jgi:predicted GIY-YIG superfamily endonuclease
MPGLLYNVLMVKKSGQATQWHLYALKLEQDKWFVGITTDSPKKAFADHKAGRGGSWTREYHPVAIEREKDLGVLDIEEARRMEGRVLRKYMEHYGDENVRCGDMSDAKSTPSVSVGGSSKWRVIATSAVMAVLVITVAFLLFDKIFIAPGANTIIYK